MALFWLLRFASRVTAAFVEQFQFSSVPAFTIATLRYGIIALAATLSMRATVWAAQTTNPTPTDRPPAAQSAPEIRLHVESNLVVVRIVVRDAQGKPVDNLRREDFRVFDRGKQQSIAQFEVERSIPQPPSPTTVVKSERPPSVAPSASPPFPSRFLALYFDDLHTSETDIMQVRDAADQYLAGNMQPKDRVAIFTSGTMLADFTADPMQIHQALAKLHASARALTRIHDCPDLSDYQALRISETNDIRTDAWKVAIDEAMNRCGLLPDPVARDALTRAMVLGDAPPSSPDIESLLSSIRSLAQSTVAQAEIQSRANLEELERMVDYISRVPGERTIILVSPGFLSQSEQSKLDRIIDQALRMQVVVSSLDSRGLALLMRESDITRGYTPAANAGVASSVQNVDWAREGRATDVLAELAEGTGGEFFHNNNDLKAGFGAVAGSPMYYILAFAPSIKRDGKFHVLKVELVEKHKGFTLRARRGYFAPQE